MLINSPHSCIPTAWSSCAGEYCCRSYMLVKWKKNVSLELSIFILWTQQSVVTFPQHTVGTIKVIQNDFSFYGGRSPFSVKMSKHLEFTCGQTLGLQLFSPITGLLQCWDQLRLLNTSSDHYIRREMPGRHHVSFKCLSYLYYTYCNKLNILVFICMNGLYCT